MFHKKLAAEKKGVNPVAMAILLKGIWTEAVIRKDLASTDLERINTKKSVLSTIYEGVKSKEDAVKTEVQMQDW
jgi:hypothetical protein